MIGLGIMGSAMSRHLVEAGWPVVGYDTTPEALVRCTALGGRPATNAAAVAASAKIIITCLPSAAALRTVVAELAAAPGACRILAEGSTFALADKKAAERALAAAGVVALDCPLSGSGSQAEQRDVLVYGNGPHEAYKECFGIFHGFSRAPHYLGPFGNGSKMKYVANLLVAIHTAAAGEAFALARKAGLDPAQMFEVVSDGAGGSRALQVRGPMLIADTYTPVRTMPHESWRKDMRVIAEFADDLAWPTPMFAASVPLFNAAVASGYGAQDMAAVCALIKDMAGIERTLSGRQERIARPWAEVSDCSSTCCPPEPHWRGRGVLVHGARCWLDAERPLACHGNNPTRARPAASLSEKSVPARSLAALVQSHATARAAHSGGMWTDGSSWLTGLRPDTLIATCISVATVPGLKPTTRMPLSRYSLSAQRVRERTAALVEQ